VSPRTIRSALFGSALLLVWGPPALREAGRGLDIALADPLQFDTAALLQVGAWVLADALAVVLIVSHLARSTSFLSALLAHRPARWYGFFGLLALASITYSASPTYTAYFAQKIVVGIVILALLEWHWPSPRTPRALQVLFVVYSLQAAAIAVLYFVDREWVVPFGAGLEPDSGPVRLTGGVFSDYGASALLSGLFFLTVVLFGTRPAHRVAAAVAYLGTWILIILSQTRSTMLAGVLFLVIMLHAHRRARVHGMLVVAGAIALVVGLLPALGHTIVSTATREGQGLDTLSGRTIAFSYLIEHWRTAPFIGHGFASGTRTALVDFVTRKGINIGAGHDALSTVLVDLGLVGLSLLVLALVTAWMSVVRCYSRTGSDLQASVTTHQITCLLLWVTIQAFVSTSLAAPNQIFIVAVIATWAVRMRHPVRAEVPLPDAAARLRR
jgi:hypothetical protein